MQNERNLYVYLPPSYKQAQNTTYPVLYMHDGQNIFHPAFNGQSWNVHHVVNRLVEQGKMQEIIIVGIENMKEERMNIVCKSLQLLLAFNRKENIKLRMNASFQLRKMERLSLSLWAKPLFSFRVKE
ncbi:esterase family protein [Priestia flexa]|nr:esterase family protein [Priestia flexa]